MRFTEFEEEWKTQKLCDFTERITRKNSDNQTQLPLTISSKDGLVDQVTHFNKQVSSKDMSGYYLLKNGEFAYNKSYSVGYDFGSVKRLDRYPMGALSTLYICFALTKHNSDFMKVYFDSLKWYKEIYMIAAEGARNHGLLNVPTDDFFDTLHILPQNPNEQDKIAKFLILVEKRIEKQQALVDNLKSYKRGLSNTIFGKKTLIINSAVKIIPLGLYCKITMGQSPDSNTYNSDHIGLPLVQGNADMKNGFTNPTKYTSMPTKTCNEGSIILSVRAPVGSVGMANQTVCVGRGVCAINSPYNEYIYQYLKYCEPKWKTIEQGGTFTAINGDDIKNFPLILPNEKDMNYIVSVLRSIDNLITLYELELENLSLYKQALLQNLFI